MIHRLMVALFVAASLSLGGVMGANVTVAQAQESYSDAKLQSFAEAAVKLIGIRSDYQSQMGDASSNEERQQLQQQTNQRMAQAVEDTDGISIEEYNEIAQASRNDQALAQKINGYIEDTAN
jgi:ribosome-binding protein aMBF1 (putative translation factor)